jgi:fluoroquinolone transport system permease protein
MKAITVLRSLGPIDLLNLRRDSALSWMIFIPILSALLLRWGVPPLAERLIEGHGFDLAPYYPVLLAYFFVVICPITFGVLIGFLLLDEKDDNTLTALQVTPLSLINYIAYRVAIPVVLTIVLMFVVFPLANLNQFDPKAIAITAIAAAPMSPFFALFLASQAQNKVQGFALMKLSGIVLIAPILAYFVNSNWEFAFGIVPTYWPMKAYWMLEADRAGVWPYVVVAVGYQSLMTAFFVRRFYRVLHQ